MTVQRRRNAEEKAKNMVQAGLLHLKILKNLSPVLWTEKGEVYCDNAASV